MMTRISLFVFLLLPFFCTAQVVDTAAVRVEVDSLVQLNRELVKQSNFEEALEVIELAERKAEADFGRNHLLFVECLFNHGRTYFNMGKYDKTEPLFLEVVTIREHLLGKDNPDYADDINNLALLYLRKKEYAKAESFFIEAKEIRGKVLGKDNLNYATTVNNLAVVYFLKGEYNKAEPLYLETKAIREKVLGKEHQEYANCLYNLGLLYTQKGDYNKAYLSYLEALAIIEKVLGKDNLNYATTLNNLANIYIRQGEYNKAELMHIEIKAIRQNIVGKEHHDYAESLINLASLYLFIGEYNKAELIYIEAKTIIEKLQGKDSYYAICIMNLGALYIEMGEYNKAEPLLLETLTIQEKLQGKEHIAFAITLNNLATNYYSQREYNKAEQMYLDAMAIIEKAVGKEHPEYATCLANLASLNQDKREYLKAGQLFEEAQAIWEKVLGRRHPNYAALLDNLAILNKLTENYDKAGDYYRESSSLYKLIFQASATYLPRQELERYISHNKDKNDAFYSFNHQTTSDTFRINSYNQALFYKGFTLEIASLLEQAMRNASDSLQDIYTNWKGFNYRLASELSKPIAERKNVARLDSMSTVLEKVLLRALPAFAAARQQIEWQAVRDALQPGEAAIEFIHYHYSDKKNTDSTMYSALLTIFGDEALHFIPLCEVRQLEAIVYKPMGTRANYLQNLYASPRADGLQSLYQLLWSPIEKLLHEHGIKTVYFSPTGLMHRINMGAISAEKSGMTLSDRYHLVPMGSTRQILSRPGKTVAGSLDEGHVQKSNALIYGGVHYEMDSSAIAVANKRLGAAAQDTTGGLFRYADKTRGENWDYLYSTEKEARYLDSLLRLRGIGTTLRLGYEATEESFKQIGQNGPSPSLLHIGTHGFFFPDPKDTTRRQAALSGDEPVFKISEFSMIRSGLKLAGSKYAWENGHPLPGGHEDGILTAYEVSQMDLSNTQLVVLSACQTGLGDIKGNEGVYGLQRAFRIAGAKNILMSLWKVNEEATEKLMTEFYKNWLELKMPLREAFEASQKWLREQDGYENPYYWAGFVLIGEI